MFNCRFPIKRSFVGCSEGAWQSPHRHTSPIEQPEVTPGMGSPATQVSRDTKASLVVEVIVPSHYVARLPARSAVHSTTDRLIKCRLLASARCQAVLRNRESDPGIAFDLNGARLTWRRESLDCFSSWLQLPMGHQPAIVFTMHDRSSVSTLDMHPQLAMRHSARTLRHCERDGEHGTRTAVFTSTERSPSRVFLPR